MQEILWVAVQTAITFVARAIRADLILFRETDKLTYQTCTFTLYSAQPIAYTGVNTTFHANDDIHRVDHRKLLELSND